MWLASPTEKLHWGVNLLHCAHEVASYKRLCWKISWTQALVWPKSLFVLNFVQLHYVSFRWQVVILSNHSLSRSQTPLSPWPAVDPGNDVDTSYMVSIMYLMNNSNVLTGYVYRTFQEVLSLTFSLAEKCFFFHLIFNFEKLVRSTPDSVA